AFVHADCSRHKCECKVYDFGERLDDVSLGHLRLKPKHLQGEINFCDTGRVRCEVADDHQEERAGMMFVKVVNFRLEMIDVMTALEDDFRTESQFAESI